MGNYDKTSNTIVHDLYPFVEKHISVQSNLNKFKNCIADFFNYNHRVLYDVAPYDIVYFKQSDIDKLFNALGIKESEVIEIMKSCYFWNLAINPQCVKEPYVLVLMMCIKYFVMTKKRKEAELAAIYLAFSGKFYASLFSGVIFPVAAPSNHREVMDYVVNNMLINKNNLKSQGNMFMAIKALCCTWLDTYEPQFKDKDLDDDEVKLLVQQLRDREKKFLGNIAKLYYQAYENKHYLNYETDNLSDTEEFRITDNDSLKATRYTDVTVSYLVNNSVSLDICNKCKDQNVKPTEIKDIMEAIISDKNNIDTLYRVINIIICDFIRNYPDKSVGSVDFIAHTIKSKPNTKDKYVIELKDTIIGWLDENSPNYRRRKNRKATAISYYRAVLLYLTLAISKAVLK